MMGKDVERVLTYLNQFKDMAVINITNLSNNTAYQITTIGIHGEEEIPVELDAKDYTLNIWKLWESSFGPGDYTKMCTLEDIHYTSSNSFNNGYASPWTELHTLKNSIIKMEDFAQAHPKLPWMGDKVGLLNLLQVVLARSTDARLSLIYYHDYIQRGYDHVFNDDNPSITFKTTIDRDSIGNLKQTYYENVNMPEESIDPY